MPFGILQTKRGENTRIEKIGAKVRKSQARKNASVIRAAIVDAAHSSKLDKRISNKAQKLAKREAKRAGLMY
jgi:hypothetical protein